MRILSTLLLATIILSSHAQTVQNVVANFDAGQVTVTYDLVGENPKRQYKVDLLSSYNKFLYSLNEVAGDIRTECIPWQRKESDLGCCL